MFERLKKIAATATRMSLSALAAALGELPKNDFLYAYTILGKDGRTPYMTRILTPRVFGRRLMFHRIWRPDADRDVHNHPWRAALSIVLTGGYVEERVDWEASILRGASPIVEFKVVTETIERTPLSMQRLDDGDFHRVASVEPGTWTLFLAGPRVQTWGFLLEDGEFMDYETYFARRGLAYEGVRS